MLAGQLPKVYWLWGNVVQPTDETKLITQMVPESGMSRLEGEGAVEKTRAFGEALAQAIAARSGAQEGGDADLWWHGVRVSGSGGLRVGLSECGEAG